MGIFRPMLLGFRFGHLQIIRRNLPVISKSNSFSVNTAVSKESKQEAQSFNHAHKQGNKRGRKGSFGIMFDIDGVFVRGRHIIPSARAAMKKVIDMDIPYIFLTNSGCETEEHKARVLTTQLHQKVIQLDAKLDVCGNLSLFYLFGTEALCKVLKFQVHFSNFPA